MRNLLPPIVEFGDVDDSDLFEIFYFLFTKEGEIAINASDLPLYVRPTIVYVLHGKKRGDVCFTFTAAPDDGR